MGTPMVSISSGCGEGKGSRFADTNPRNVNRCGLASALRGSSARKTSQLSANSGTTRSAIVSTVSASFRDAPTSSLARPNRRNRCSTASRFASARRWSVTSTTETPTATTVPA